MLRKILYLLLIALIIIQFFHPENDNESNPGSVSNDIGKVFPLPNNVQSILQNSCYDCHSNHTEYPWYAEIQPVSWWLNDHIEEGKREINFNEFASYRAGRQYKKLKEIIEQVKNNSMPLSSYTFIHRDAVLNKDQKLLLSGWASALMDSLKARYPEDSLKKK